MSKEKLYLAGGYGFKEINRLGIMPLIEILSRKFELINPFDEAESLGKQIVELEKELKSENPSMSPAKVLEELRKINWQIGQGNENHIRKCDRIFAILDGTDQDAGMASECSFGYALGKRSDGYRGDFRPSGENSACIVALQLEYFIRASGGDIFFSFKAVEELFIK